MSHFLLNDEKTDSKQIWWIFSLTTVTFQPFINPYSVTEKSVFVYDTLYKYCVGYCGKPL